MAGYVERITGVIPHTNKSVDIPIDGKNLIITGGNGSGKTSFLRSVYEKTYLLIVDRKQADLPELRQSLQDQVMSLTRHTTGTTNYDNCVNDIKRLQNEIGKIEDGLQIIISNNIQFSSKCDDRQAVVLYFEDKRLADIIEAKMPQGLQTEIEESKTISHNQKVGNKLEQHFLNLKTRRSFAITEEGNENLASTIDVWFKEFEKNLKHLFEDDSAKLSFDSNRNKFFIEQDNKPVYTFQTLSAGYKAIFDVYADLIMRTKYFSVDPTLLEGVVFVDEIDSHLHISLQRLILPFFVRSFPKIQFIVTTHSPFVLMSTKDTLVYDLAKEISYSITKAKSQNDILSDYLGIPTAMPVWAEESLTNILKKYINCQPEAISFEALREELKNAGLEEYFSSSATEILEAKQ
jgi:predicted ATP-binding protein involved in virulence